MRTEARLWALLLGTTLTLASLTVVGLAQTATQPARAVPDPGVITTRQTITPAGVQSVFDGRVFGVTFGERDDEVWVLTGRTKSGQPRVYQLDWLENRVKRSWDLTGTPSLQGLVFDASRKSPIVGVTVTAKEAGGRAGGAVRLLHLGASGFEPLAADLGRHLSGGAVLSRSANGSSRIVVPLTFENAVAVVDADGGRVEATVKTSGVAPFGAAISRSGDVAWVTNWGGRLPRDGNLSLPTGLDPTADRVVVDARGIASTGTIARIDLASRTLTHTVQVGLQPTALAWDEPRQRLYVANSNSDTISIVDTTTQVAVATVAIEPFGLTLPGVAPTALAIAPDGATVYAALGGFNAVAVIDVAASRVRGFIPTGWYRPPRTEPRWNQARSGDLARRGLWRTGEAHRTWRARVSRVGERRDHSRLRGTRRLQHGRGREQPRGNGPAAVGGHRSRA